MADPNIAPGQYMLTESAKELKTRKGHLFLPIVPIVMIFEPYPVFINRKEPMVTDGSFMCVPAKVFNHLLRATKWFFGIYHPIGFFKFPPG